jgi:hypothetical protein
MSSSHTGRVRSTKTVVDKLKPGEVRWDIEVRGFGVRCQRQARKYALKARMNGRQRRFTIGEHGSPWTPDSARKEALNLLADIHKGTDIASLRTPSRQQPTMADLSKRYLQGHAYQHKKASSAAENKRNIDNDVVPFLGSRLVTEVTAADIDIFKRAVKTGKKPIYPNSLAREILSAPPRIGSNAFVIVGSKTGYHLVNIRKPWYRIRKAADIDDVRIHDLRHSFASIAVSGGLTLPLIGKLLGHRKSATTERYAHLADGPVRAANEEVVQLLGRSFKRSAGSGN